MTSKTAWLVGALLLLLAPASLVSAGVPRVIVIEEFGATW